MSKGVRTPNVIYVLADNLGWGDLGCYGAAVPTPNIDEMASAGLRLTNYSVEAQCTPTRSALMTGRLPVRSGTYRILLPGEGEYGLSPWEYTLADLMSDAGYQTAMFGKWHLGDTRGRLPTDQGFDLWWGIKNTSDEAGYAAHPLFTTSGLDAPQIWEARRGADATPVGPFDLDSRPFLDEEITKRAVDFIHAPRSQPFFLYIGLTNVHPPIIPHPAFAGTSGGGARADVMCELDHRVGEIRRAVREAGIQRDTVIVFASDNAALEIEAETGGSNGPWRGNFFTPPFEGSYRVPAIIEWPDRIPSGHRSNEMLSAVDWLPTLARLVEADDRVPTDRPIDGLDCSNVLLDKAAESPRRWVAFYGGDARLMSVKWEQLKVVYRYSRGATEPVVTPQFPMMFDLATDPGERWNIFETRLDNLWMLQPATQALQEIKSSMQEFPNIEPGAEFKGYC